MFICWISNNRDNVDVKFEDQLSEVERAAWKSFQNVTTHLLKNHKAENYCDMVADLVQSHKAMRRNMSLKVSFLDSHLDFLPENLGAVSDFTWTFLPRKSGTKASGVPECWLIIKLLITRDVPQARYSRKSSSVTVK